MRSVYLTANTLINNGSNGIVFEINSEMEIVWEYVIPLSGNTPFNQGQNANGSGATFRVYKYPSGFQGFNGLDLIPSDVIETDPSPEFCPLTSANDVFKLINNFYYSSETQSIQVEILTSGESRLNVYNTIGQNLMTKRF